MWPFDQGTIPGSRDIEVAAARREGRRVAADIAGRSVWFESDDVVLEPAPEAFAAGFLVPAMHAGRLLTVRSGVCDTWAARLPRLVSAFRHLWYPDAPGAHALPAGRPGPHASGTALCFSGGVDAFHTLLAAGRRIDLLAYVVGYDVKLREHRRASAVARLLGEVAAETGTRPVVIRTNLRRHPLHRAAPWLRSFGGALAAAGHLLSPVVARLLISSDGLGREDPEVGARAATDWLHGSARVEIEHVAPGTTRLEKIRTIAAEPLVQRHLRVCWRNVGDRMNCGRCEKCVRTMLALDLCGRLGRFPGFDRGRGLEAAIDALPAIDQVVTTFYRDLLANGLAGCTAAAVDRLIARSAPGRTLPAERASPARRPPARRLLDVASFAPVFEPLIGRRVGYVKPIGNVGDELIELAMAQLLAEFGIRWRSWEPAVRPDVDLLLFGGGGNMGTRYLNNHAVRGRALATGLPLVILPQTFSTPEERPFERVYVRERGSLEFCPHGILAPDLALGLAWPRAGRPTRDLGIFLRRDRERSGPRPVFARDPARLCTSPGGYLALAAAHRRIVTDRLHFAIAGLHAGRDVTLVANAYHKNRSMHEAWLERLGCRFAASPREALAPRRAA